MPEFEHFDLVVIGAGPAGEKAAAQAAYFKKRVAIIECEPEPGGAAVHTGTLPSKTLRETALYLSGYHARELYGVALELDRNATLPRLMSRKNAIAAAESRSFRKNLAHHDVHYIARAWASAGRTHGVRQLEGRRTAHRRRFHPDRDRLEAASPGDIDFADDWIHDSDEILTIDDLPTSMTILGGGVIGCEYACMFAALGVAITLVDARAEILPFLDAEIVARLKAAMIKLGIRLVQGQRWTTVLRSRTGVVTTLADGTHARERAATVRCRAHGLRLGSRARKRRSGGRLARLHPGRRAVSHQGSAHLRRRRRDRLPRAGLGLDGARPRRDVPRLRLWLQEGRRQRCPTASTPSPRSARSAKPKRPASRRKSTTWRGARCSRTTRAAKSPATSKALPSSWSTRKTRKLIGVHVIGERATELVHIGQTAIHLGATVDVFIDMVFNYPTLADSYKYAAYHCLAALAAKQ